MRSGTIPPLLSPYLTSFKQSSLVLITSVLGASANWLLLRFLAAAATTVAPIIPPGPSIPPFSPSIPPSIPSLSPSGSSGPFGPSSASRARARASNDDGEEGISAAAPTAAASATAPTGVILVSFLRDYEFWREGARKLGIDISRLAAQDRFICVDGLSELFRHGQSKLGPAVVGDHVVLRDPRLESVEKSVLELISRVNHYSNTSRINLDFTSGAQERRTLLIVDGLDFLMAATEGKASAVLDTIMNWRENVHKMVITASADSPLIHDIATPIEQNHLEFAVSLAHQSEVVVGLRLLDTGTAKDVSGVLSIRRGAEADVDVDENEYLYFVGGDGGAKVFSRGATT